MIWRWDLGQRKEEVGESVGPQQCGCRTGSRERNHHDWTTGDGLLERDVCLLIWNGFSFCAAGHLCDILTLCTTPTPFPGSLSEGQWTAKRSTSFGAKCLGEWSGGRLGPHLESKVQQKHWSSLGRYHWKIRADRRSCWSQSWEQDVTESNYLSKYLLQPPPKNPQIYCRKDWTSLIKAG